jgi:hypothetical protein
MRHRNEECKFHPVTANYIIRDLETETRSTAPTGRLGMCPPGWEEANLLNREVKNKALDMIYRGEFANNACGYINALFRYSDT